MKLLKTYQLPKLNSKGFGHHIILPVLVIAVVAAVGVRVMVASHAATPTLKVKVSGNKLVNQNGTPIVLRGINYSGNEYSCVSSAENYSVFQGPNASDDPSFVTEMLKWHIHVVRLSLNEDCWLGINGVSINGESATASGATYRQQIQAFVNLLTSNGIYTILDLHNSGPGTALSITQFPMADKGHSLAFWTSVATTFRQNQAVMFDLFNEPFVGNTNVTTNPVNGVTPSKWKCWLNGCSLTFTYTNQNDSPTTVTYAAAGMQAMINAVRNPPAKGGASAANVLLLGGLNYANDTSGWLANEPSDPDHNLVADAHIYGNDTCGAYTIKNGVQVPSTTCLDDYVAPVAKKVPVLFDEIGETYDDSECGNTNTKTIMTWADSHNIGYLPWAYDAWGTCDALISDWSGTQYNTLDPPGQTYAKYVYDHLISFP